jgi:F-type H+-transporting ATPase subunit delta
MAKLVSKTYGDALFDLGIEEGCMDELQEDAGFVLDALKDNEDLGKLLNNPKVDKEKEKVMAGIFGDNVSKNMSGLLELMVSKQRHNDIADTLAYFLGKVKEYNNIGIAYVTTAVELDDRQKAAVEKKLLDTTRYVKFEMNYSVDSSILGGMIIRIGDRVVDSSIRNKLDSLTRDLRKVQLGE